MSSVSGVIFGREEGQQIDLQLKIAWKCKNNNKEMGSGCF